ncbi:amino acid ABC transporter permease [Arthrobacter castelli]|uniref:amino acid ABC transporter permease n=1 Tax=Arthrobacter castelli TaxID=271431 RepID=UPI0009D714CE|nr:amino acid ABC transporter permease [Arthrobacter castelli]
MKTPTERTAQRLTDKGEIRAEALLPIKPRPSIAKWASIVLAVYVFFVGLEFFVFNENWNWPLVFEYLFGQRILQGLLNTITLTLITTLLGLFIGILVAWAKLSPLAVLRKLAAMYIWVIRATPLLVLLLMIFFLAALVPSLGIGIPFGPSLFEVPTNEVISRFTAAVLGLSLYLGGKSAEVFRSGIIAVDRGQFEACRAVGLSPLTTYTRVIGPQSIRVITPPMANEIITMFKNTSLVSVIGYTELLTTAKLIYATNFQTIPLLTVAVIWYLTLTSIAMYGQSLLEKRFGRGFDRRTDKEEQREPTEKVETRTSTIADGDIR